MKKLKKDKGGIDNYLFIPIMITAVVILLLSVIPIFSLLSDKSEIDQIGRTYLLKMESDGYLSSDMKSQLIDDLKSIKNVKNIDILDTTETRVGYGQKVYLKFIVTYNYEILSGNQLLNKIISSEEKKIVYSKCSTAKY